MQENSHARLLSYKARKTSSNQLWLWFSLPGLGRLQPQYSTDKEISSANAPVILILIIDLRLGDRQAACYRHG
jgi:hypothetical protein